MLLIDTARQILFRNGAALRVLRAGRGLAEKNGQIVMGSACCDDALRSLIIECSHKPWIVRGLRVTRPGAWRDWLLLLRPMGVRLIEDQEEPIFFVQIVGRTRARAVPIHVLSDLFALSDRESAVISDVLRTGSLGEAANRLNIRRETIRSHLKRIFGKCDVHSQEELVSLIHCLSQFAAGP